MGDEHLSGLSVVRGHHGCGAHAQTVPMTVRTRPAQVRLCPCCGSVCLAGLDADLMADSVMLDLDPIDPRTEVDHPDTYEVVAGKINYRTIWARSVIPTRPVRVPHDCGGPTNISPSQVLERQRARAGLVRTDLFPSY